MARNFYRTFGLNKYTKIDTTTLGRNHEYSIPTKTNRLADDEQCMITISHLRVRLLCPENGINQLLNFTLFYIILKQSYNTYTMHSKDNSFPDVTCTCRCALAKFDFRMEPTKRHNAIRPLLYIPFDAGTFGR